MLRLLLMLLFAASFTEARFFPEGKIVGGREVRPNSLPYQLSFQDIRGGHICGASILDEKHALTAAHCCDGFYPRDVKVVAGEHDLTVESGNEQYLPVAKIIIHEDYRRRIPGSDICILELLESFQFNEKVSPILLPEDGKEFTGSAVVSGWGSMGFDPRNSRVLMAVKVPLIDREACNEIYYGGIDETMICAGKPGKDSCQGDSGGPLMCGSVRKNIQCGIVSGGEECGNPTSPGIYTNVAHYTNWIRNKAPPPIATTRNSVPGQQPLISFYLVISIGLYLWNSSI